MPSRQVGQFVAVALLASRAAFGRLNLALLQQLAHRGHTGLARQQLGARLFGLQVGPRQTGRYGMVIPTFVKQALAGRPITVYGNGKQTRCFGYVGDVVGALIKLMDTTDSVGQVFNIGSTEEISILQLAEKVKQLTESRSEIVFVPYDEAYEEGFEDMPRRVPDTSKINRLVGFKPEITLDGILETVISFHRSRPASFDE